MILVVLDVIWEREKQDQYDAIEVVCWHCNDCSREAIDTQL